MNGTAPSTLSMTWPQFLRRECTFNGRRIRLRESEARVLIVLLMRRGYKTDTATLTEMIYHIDEEPEYGYQNIMIFIMWLRRKLPGQIHHTRGFGYFIEDVPSHAVKRRLRWRRG